MQPIPALRRALDEQLIKVLIRIIRIVQQDNRIAQGLFNSIHSDIRRAPREMVAPGRTPYPLINLGATIPAVDVDGGRTIAIEQIILLTQMLQPSAKAFQILDVDMARDVSILRLHFRDRHLAQRKMRREFHTFINFYVIHHLIIQF